MIKWDEASTKRGVVWILTGLIAAGFSFAGKDSNQILTIGAAVAGGMGLLPDKVN